MPMYYYGGYSYFLYMLYMLPGLIVAIWAQAKVKSAYSKYSRVPNLRGITGAMAAEAVLMASGVSAVAIRRVSGEMTDHYNPADNTIYLSDGVYDSTSIAAVGIAAHEAGHAVQYAENYGPIKFRMAIVPVCNFGSRFGIPIAFIGALLSIMELVWVGIILFGLTLLFQLVTLPVEFNASRRALSAINNGGLLTGDEAHGAKSVLSAAAMTYVAAMLQSMLSFLYFFMRFIGNNRNKR
ncbi:MAG: zinc metallopeptidase [Firmicutes bacterium]|nr:zinc metallopeptidase [Bacillota bacterium]